MSSVSLRYSAGAICASLLAVLLISCGSSSPEQSSTPTETETPAVDEASSDTGKSAADEPEDSKASTDQASSSTERLSMPRVSTTQASEVISLTLDLRQQLPSTSIAALRVDEIANDVCSGFNYAEAKKSCDGAIRSVDAICDEAVALVPSAGLLAEGVLGEVEGCKAYFKAMIIAVADRSRAAEMCGRLEDAEQISICQVWSANLNAESDDICGFAGIQREMCLADLVKFIGDLWGEQVIPLLQSVVDAGCEDSSSDAERDRCVTVAVIVPAFEAACELVADVVSDSELDDCLRIMAPMTDFLISFMDVTFAASAPCYETYEEDLERQDCMAISMLFASKAFCSQLPSAANSDDSSGCLSLEEICNNLSSVYDSDIDRCLEVVNLTVEGCEELSDRNEKESCQIAQNGCDAISVISRRDDCFAAIEGMNVLSECTEASSAAIPETAACLRNLEGG